jgi:isopenicillin N synthase-like dioxygenase
MENDIPLLDFSSLNIGENLDETNPEINKLAQELYDAFTTAGFVYIKNHGIPESQVFTFSKLHVEYWQ